MNYVITVETTTKNQFYIQFLILVFDSLRRIGEFHYKKMPQPTPKKKNI